MRRSPPFLEAPAIHSEHSPQVVIAHSQHHVSRVIMATRTARMIRTLWSEAGAVGHWARRCVLALLFAAFADPVAWAAAEQEVYITQDNTPLFAAPAEDAKVVLRANAGHRLFVLERAGDWLKVFTPQYILVGEEMWVKADLVGPPPARTESLPAPTAENAAPPLAPEFRLDVDGTPGLEIVASCRVVDDGSGSQRLFERSALAPVAYTFIGAALSCSVEKRDDFGRLEVALRGPDGTLIATAETAAFFGSVLVRSDGPWGDADASRGPSALFLVPDNLHFRFGRPPAGTPVPPFSSPPVPPLSGLSAPPPMAAP